MARSMFLLAATAATIAAVGAAPITKPSASSSASAAPTALPKVDSKGLQDSITKDALSQKAKELEQCALSTPHRNRVLASEGHNNTLDMIERYLDTVSDYYTYRRQGFETTYFQPGPVKFTAAGKELKTTSYLHTPGGNISAPVMAVASYGCNATDYPSDLTGKIALVEGKRINWPCNVTDQNNLARAAGAVGLVVHSSYHGYLAGLDDFDQEEIVYLPTLGIEREDGTALNETLRDGEEVHGLFEVGSLYERRTTYNIIVDTKGGDKDNVLLVGAHTDSSYEGPGINDNGSGMIVLLETVLQLSNYSVNNAVRFGFWTAEETGLRGSQHYVNSLSQEDLMKIRLYLNLEMVANKIVDYEPIDGDGSDEQEENVAGPPGSAEVEVFFQDFLKKEGFDTVDGDSVYNGGSDHSSFAPAGIPVGGIHSGQNERFYHHAKDDYSNLGFKAFVTSTRAIAAATAKWAMSFEGFPRREMPGQQ